MKTIKTVALFLSLSLAGLNAITAQTAAQNKATAIRGMDAINAKDFTTLASLVTDDFTEYSAPAPVTGKDAFIASIKGFLGAFPDYKSTLVKAVSEGNTVMILSTITGTMTKDLGDMKATGKSFKYMDVDILEFNAQGKVAKHWSVQDPMVMMSQIAK